HTCGEPPARSRFFQPITCADAGPRSFLCPRIRSHPSCRKLRRVRGKPDCQPARCFWELCQQLNEEEHRYQPLLEDGLNVTIDLKAESVEIQGAARDVARAEQVFSDYDHLQRNGYVFQNGDLGSMLRVVVSDATATLRGLAEAGRQRAFGRRTVQPKSINQRRYLEAIESHDMIFGIGPAG